jgi:phenylacetate-coenzyme A ligase PaaK-like adenylate-forming protein
MTGAERPDRAHSRSSGTTGKPTVVGYTERDVSNWADLVARSIRAAGGKPGDKVHVAYGYGLFTGGWVPTMEPSGSVVLSSRCRVARPSDRCS